MPAVGVESTIACRNSRVSGAPPDTRSVVLAPAYVGYAPARAPGGAPRIASARTGACVRGVVTRRWRLMQPPHVVGARSAVSCRSRLAKCDRLYGWSPTPSTPAVLLPG